MLKIYPLLTILIELCSLIITPKKDYDDMSYIVLSKRILVHIIYNSWSIHGANKQRGY